MKIIGFAGSNSKRSINKQLVNYTIAQFEGVSLEVLSLNDYECELYNIDHENKTGIPDKILRLAKKLDKADLLILSLAEHNGTYSASFKNTYDWLSRIPNRKVFNNKPILLMATSPGARGGSSVLMAAKERFPRDGGQILETFSLPKFDENFDTKKGITNTELSLELTRKINTIKQEIFEQYFLKRVFTCGIDNKGIEDLDSSAY